MWSVAFEQPAVAVISTNNPRGAAWAGQISQALAKAWDGDPRPRLARGAGVQSAGRRRQRRLSGRAGRFVEAIIALGFWRPAAVEILTTASQVEGKRVVAA